MNDIKDLIELIADFIVQNLAVILPLSFIVVKLILIRISGHREDQWRALLTIPEDVSYGAMAFVVAGLSGAISEFGTYFKDSHHPRTDIAVLFGLSVLVCFIVHLIHQYGVLPHYKAWRAADEVLNQSTRKEEGKQKGSVLHQTELGLVYFWKFGSFVLFFMIEFALAAGWLSRIAAIIESR